MVAGVQTGDYLPYSGQKAYGLRICNFIESRMGILLWDFHGEASEAIPVGLVGHNPNMTGVMAAKSWDQLKKVLKARKAVIERFSMNRFKEGIFKSNEIARRIWENRKVPH